MIDSLYFPTEPIILESNTEQHNYFDGGTCDSMKIMEAKPINQTAAFH